MVEFLGLSCLGLLSETWWLLTDVMTCRTHQRSPGSYAGQRTTCACLRGAPGAPPGRPPPLRAGVGLGWGGGSRWPLSAPPPSAAADDFLDAPCKGGGCSAAKGPDPPGCVTTWLAAWAGAAWLEACTCDTCTGQVMPNRGRGAADQLVGWLAAWMAASTLVSTNW